MEDALTIFILGVVIGSLLQYYFDILGRITVFFLRASYAKKRYV